MRRAGRASPTARPASSVTVSAAARARGEACSDPRHAARTARTTARWVRNGERCSTVPPARDFSGWRERGRLLASGERLAFPVIPVAWSRADCPLQWRGRARAPPASLAPARWEDRGEAMGGGGGGGEADALCRLALAHSPPPTAPLSSSQRPHAN